MAADKRSLVVNVDGLGSKGLEAALGAEAFEVLGACDPQPAAGTCTDAVCLCWMATPMTTASKTSVTIGGLPVSPRAVRYLWYISPYAIGGKLLRPFEAPIYALADPIPNAAPIPGGADSLVRIFALFFDRFAHCFSTVFRLNCALSWVYFDTQPLGPFILALP